MRWPKFPTSARTTPVYSTIDALTLRQAARALKDGRGHAYGAIEREVLADKLEDAARRAQADQIVTVAAP